MVNVSSEPLVVGSVLMKPTGTFTQSRSHRRWMPTGELVADAFELAAHTRSLDMRASPYDLKEEVSYPPIRDRLVGSLSHLRDRLDNLSGCPYI